jgi:hypothetical protein
MGAKEQKLAGVEGVRAQSEAGEKGETRQGEKEAEHLTVRGGGGEGKTEH